MTSKFIIWTMRRTGGTSFANILAEVAGCQIEHEPFNWDRKFGFITKNFSNNKKNIVNLQSDLNQFCIQQDICLKHCYEIIGNVLNLSLIEILANTNYKHIFLLRRNELLRLISLYLAKQTDVWGKHGSKDTYQKYISGELKLKEIDILEIEKHYYSCQKITNSLQDKMHDCNINFIELYFEDLYSGNLEERISFLNKRVFAELDIDLEVAKEKLQKSKYFLLNANQKSSDLYKLIPNLEEIREAFPDCPI